MVGETREAKKDEDLLLKHLQYNLRVIVRAIIPNYAYDIGERSSELFKAARDQLSSPEEWAKVWLTIRDTERRWTAAGSVLIHVLLDTRRRLEQSYHTGHTKRQRGHYAAASQEAGPRMAVFRDIRELGGFPLEYPQPLHTETPFLVHILSTRCSVQPQLDGTACIRHMWLFSGARAVLCFNYFLLLPSSHHCVHSRHPQISLLFRIVNFEGLPELCCP